MVVPSEPSPKKLSLLDSRARVEHREAVAQEGDLSYRFCTEARLGGLGIYWFVGTAFSVGIVIIDLANNAVKYAFPHPRSGAIEVRTSHGAHESVRRTVLGGYDGNSDQFQSTSSDIVMHLSHAA
jgi:hypothetical protein